MLSTIPQFSVFQGGEIVTVSGIGFVDSRFLKCKWFSKETPWDPPNGDAIYAGKHQNYLSDPSHPSHNVTYLNSFRVLCRQPPSINGKPTFIPAYIEVSLDGQLYSENAVTYAVYGRPAGLGTRTPQLSVLADVQSVVETITIYTTDEVGHELLHYDQNDLRRPFKRDITMNLRNLQVADNSNLATSIIMEGVSSRVMEFGVIDFPNITLLKPPTGSVQAEFSHIIRGFTLNKTTATFDSYIVAEWKTSVTILVLSGQAVSLNIRKQPSNVSNHATELPLTVQPELEFFDPAHNVVTKPNEATIGVVAEWRAFVWKDVSTNKSEISSCQRPGLCECVPSDLKKFNYSYSPSDAEVCWSAMKSSGLEPVFVDKHGAVVFRNVKLVGFHGIIYKLRFRVTVPAAMGKTVQPVESHFIHVGSCSPASTTYAVEFSEQCKPCPPNALCNGTIHIKGAPNHWRATNLTTTFYPCAPANSPCLSDTVCNVTACDNPCAEGHKGVECSVCKEGYGNSGGKCILCPKSEEVCRLFFLLVFPLFFFEDDKKKTTTTTTDESPYHSGHTRCLHRSRSSR